jgi:hypothetical protein
MFRAALWRQMDRRTSAARTFFTLSKWIGTRTQTLSAGFVGALAVYLVYGPRPADPAAVGFSLNVAAGFSSQILWLVTTLNELEGACLDGRWGAGADGGAGSVCDLVGIVRRRWVFGD